MASTRRAIAGFIVGAFLALTTSGIAVAQQPLRGIALSIGQSDYKTLADLPNTANDADAMDDLLARLGFESTPATDRDSRRLRRDLGLLVDDAEGVDVALLYYAGHAVEIDGENYLVPTDADASTPEKLGASLIALTPVIEHLRQRAKVAIILLDACRDNPLPLAMRVALPDGRVGVAGASGLQTRSVQVFRSAHTAATADTPANLGIVVAFAAEPGKVALDGDPGTNSPYAAALLRHISAMAGQEFGTVMRMVAEEVYLKTGGRQRPWVNESLRRLLYFGQTSADPQGDEGDILAERRQLLLTIADLPDPERSVVEGVARAGDVPMDALYGMVRSLGASGGDLTELEKLLDEQARKLKAFASERAALSTPDDEIRRLSALADEAVSEGALTTALRLHERAKARLKKVTETLDRAEADLRARRIEAAEIYFASARAYELALDYIKAADDYEFAAGQVELWDRSLQARYKTMAMLALQTQGDFKGDPEALTRGVRIGREAVAIAEATGDKVLLSGVLSDFGGMLRIIGGRQPDRMLLDEAAHAYRRTLEISGTNDLAPGWWLSRSGLANVLLMLALRESGTGSLDEGIAAYEQALTVVDRDARSYDWAMISSNLGSAYVISGYRRDDLAAFDAGVAAFKDAMTVWTREANPLRWSGLQNNLCNALMQLGSRRRSVETLRAAIRACEDALLERPIDSYPMQWAATKRNLGDALSVLGQESNDEARFHESLAAYEDALTQTTFERSPFDWATLQYNRGMAFKKIADRRLGRQWLDKSIAAYRLSLQVRSMARGPIEWANTADDLAVALTKLAELETGTVGLHEAVELWRSVLAVRTREALPGQWAFLQQRIGDALTTIGDRETGTQAYEEAAVARRLALQVWTRTDHPDDYAYDSNMLGSALRRIAQRGGDVSLFDQAIAAYGEALPLKDRAKQPLAWARVRSNIGLALSYKGKRIRDAATLREAVAALGEVAALRTRERDGVDWSWAQINLGEALASLSELDNDPLTYERAAAAYEAGAPAFRESNKPVWRLARDGAADALLLLGQARDDIAILERAVAAYRESGEGLDPATDAAGWVAVQVGIGIAYGTIAREGGGIASHEQALAAFKAVLSVADPAKHSANFARLYLESGRSLVTIGVERKDPALLVQAIDHYRQTDPLWTVTSNRRRWMEIRERTAYAFGRLADIEKAPARTREQAAELARLMDVATPDDADYSSWSNEYAYAVLTVARDSGDFGQIDTALRWARVASDEAARRKLTRDEAFSRDTLCDVLIEIGRLRADRAAVTEAIAACERARTIEIAERMDDTLTITEENLAKARALLAELK